MSDKVLSKLLALGLVLVMALIVFAFWRLFHLESDSTVSLSMESDAMSVVNYYYPLRLRLQDAPMESELVFPPQAGQRFFTGIFLGDSADSLFSIMLLQNTDGSSALYIDRNNNEDLTDDGEPLWDEALNGYATKEVLLEVAYHAGSGETLVPYPIIFYRYEGKLTDSIIAYRNGYRSGQVVVADTSYQIGVFDDDCDGLFDDLDQVAIVFDLNQDGLLDGRTDSNEYFEAEDVIVVNGRGLKVTKITPSGDVMQLVMVDTVAAPGADAQFTEVPSFQTFDVDGNMFDSAELKGKVVLVDFWATWCKPWEAQRDILKKLYRRYNLSNFQIIGANLDYDVAHLREYLSEHQIEWLQIGDGGGWDMPLVEVFKVRSLPKNFLVDHNGIIRYKDLSGSDLESKVYELLAEAD